MRRSSVVALSLALLAGAGAATAAHAAKQYVVEYGNAQQVGALIAGAGGSLIRDLPQVGVAIAASDAGGFAARLARSNGITAVSEDVEINWLPGVQAADSLESMLAPGAKSHDPTTAAFFPLQWSLRATDTDLAWNVTTGDPDVKVAVLDTGVCEHHIDLAGQVDDAHSTSFVIEPSGACASAEAADCADGCNSWEDYQFHGTHVASIVAGAGVGVSGVAPHTTLRAVKVLNCNGSGSFGAIISGIVYAADTGNDVINMSLGALFPKSAHGAGPLVGALNKAVNYAKSRGVLVVSAAGNEGVDLQHAFNFTSVPCESGAGLCVGATDWNDDLASYSNHGVSGPQLVAPGGDVNQIPQSFILGACSAHSAFVPSCADGLHFIWVVGTSQATPHVAGLAALVDAVAPEGPGSWDAAQLRSRILGGLDDLGAAGTDNLFSHGRMNANHSVQ